MNATWPKVRLGEILNERRETPDAEALTLGNIRIVSKIGFELGRIELRQEVGTKTGMILVRPGDLLLSGINAAKGAIAIYGRENAEPVAATIHYGTYSVVQDRTDIEYLWWYLRSKPFREILFQSLPEGIKTELKSKRLLSIEIPLPPLTEQRRIMVRIESLAYQVAESRGLRRDSTALTKGLAEAAIESTMMALPQIGRLSEVVSFKPRSGPSFVTNTEWRGTPVLMPSAVSGFGVDTTKVEFGIGGERISPKDRLQPGDILIARGNKREQVGNAGVVPENAEGWVCANLLMRMQLDPELAYGPFFVYWLRAPTMRRHVADRMTGTNPNIQKINQGAVLNFPFPTGLSVSQQRSIVAYLDDVQARTNALKRMQAETAAELNALLPSILDRAFKGQL